MMDINKLPNKINELNYFKKNEECGSKLISYSQKNDITIVVDFEEFEIEKDFQVDSNAIKMLKILEPIESIKIGKTFTIKSKKGEYKSKLIDINIVPMINMDYQYSMKVNLKNLKIASKFVSKENKRPILTGVNVNSKGICATDSFKAYFFRNKNVDETIKPITIPSEFIEFICKNVPNDLGEITINYNNYNCMIEINNVKYISRLLEGSYPDLSKLFNLNGNVIEFNNNEFKEKISIIKNIGDSSLKDFKSILLTFSSNKLVAEGDNDFECELLDSNKNEYDFTISIDNLEPIISNISSDNLNIYYVSDLKPIIFTECDNNYLVLPVRRN